MGTKKRALGPVFLCPSVALFTVLLSRCALVFARLQKCLRRPRPANGVDQSFLPDQCGKNRWLEDHRGLAVGFVDEVEIAANQDVPPGICSWIRHFGELFTHHRPPHCDHWRSRCLRRHAKPEQLSHAQSSPFLERTCTGNPRGFRSCWRWSALEFSRPYPRAWQHHHGVGSAGNQLCSASA